MGGSSTTEKQNSTTTNEPWGPAVPHITDIFTDAKKMYDYGAGPQVWSGSTVAPFSVPTQEGLTKGYNMAQTGNPFAAGVQNYATSTINSGGTNPFMLEAKANIDPTAQGNMLEGNPFFQKALDFQSGKIEDRVNSVFSGAGRGLSGSHARALAEELAGQRFGALSNQFNNERAFQMDANKMLAGMGSDASSVASNLVNNASNIDALRYNDIDRMFKIGNAIESKQGDVLNEAKEKFDLQNMLPWQHLALYKDSINPNVGGTSTTTGKGSTSTPFNPVSLLGIPMMAAGGK